MSSRSSSPLRLAMTAPLLAAALTGCVSLGPAYERPALTPPAAYSTSAEPGPIASAPIASAWWRTFGDPALDRLVDEALAANQDLVAAAARIEEARALYGLSRADRYPVVTAGASARRSRLSADAAQLPPGFPLETTTHEVTLDVSFEVDFWGRLRRASEAARAELLASEAGRRNLELAITAEVVGAYFDALTFDRQLAVARETLTSRQESVALQRVRFDAGTISELELAQAEAELAATEAALPALERGRRQTENRLGILLGRIGSGAIDADGTRLDATALPAVPVGLPSDLLARRPDIVAAEQQLIAAHARIAVARAAYFPTLSLTGSAGTASQQLADLLSSGTSVWNLAAGLLQPIFNAGRAKRGVEAARARETQALATYTKALQTAFAEVEDALVARRTASVEREALARQVDALDRAHRLADLRYEAGESSYFEVLDAERNLFQAQLALARVRRDELAAAVSLFKALGGGWGTPDENR